MKAYELACIVLVIAAVVGVVAVAAPPAVAVLCWRAVCDFWNEAAR